MKARAYRNIIIAASAAAALLAATTSCGSTDHTRTPPAPVYIAFPTQPEWTLYGTPSALDYKEFILNQTPADFPWTAMTRTGYGGVLLVGDIMGNPAAYDLSCPYENRTDIRIRVDNERLDAFCPKCGSRYFIFDNYGRAYSGPAYDMKYELRRYSVGPGGNGVYMAVR